MRKNYAIRCGSRTGSTLLCELLRSTNRCGKPEEYVNPSLIDGYRKEIGLPQDANMIAYRNKLFNKRSSENGVFGIKVVGITEQAANFENMEMKTSHWIRLYREDKILQAISRYKAWATNIWHRKPGVVVPSVPYSFKDIDWCLKEIVAEEKHFDDFFADKDHISISYEFDLLEDPEQTAIACLTYMDINIEDLPNFKSNGNLHRDRQSYEWQERYLKDVVWASYEDWHPQP